MGKNEILWIFSAFVFLNLIPSCLCWGKDGHYTVCKIAEKYLSAEASSAVKKLLPKYAEGELAPLCIWADQIRFRYRWSGALHFCDTPDYKCNYDHNRDCHDTKEQKDACVTGAINNYTMQLVSSYNKPNIGLKYNLTEALLFLAHFIGDVHQPLHIGFLGDEGGNSIIVHWYRRKTNLHHVWDSSIIESAVKSFYRSELSVMINAIQSNITDDWANDILQWESCALNRTACPDPYASESIDLACKYGYRNATPGSTLGDDYFLSRLPVVEKTTRSRWDPLSCNFESYLLIITTYLSSMKCKYIWRKGGKSPLKCQFETIYK